MLPDHFVKQSGHGNEKGHDKSPGNRLKSVRLGTLDPVDEVNDQEGLNHVIDHEAQADGPE